MEKTIISIVTYNNKDIFQTFAMIIKRQRDSFW